MGEFDNKRYTTHVRIRSITNCVTGEKDDKPNVYSVYDNKYKQNVTITGFNPTSYDEIKIKAKHMNNREMFRKMSKEEAISYCYKHENKFKAELYESGDNGERQFDCLIDILDNGTIEPIELPSYGMDYGE